jgi:hypothetical protein
LPRYISKYGGYKKTVLKSQRTLVSTPLGPEDREIRTAVIAEFKKGGVTAWEKEQALQHFRMVQPIESTDPDHASYSITRDAAGMYEGEDLTTRFSYYDTDEQAFFNKWSPEKKVEIEKNLNDQQNSDYFRCDKPKRPAPWPAYDKLVKQGQRTIALVAEKIAAKVTEDGYDPENVIAYETENLNRPEVVDALKKLLVEKVPEETVAA